ncbi:MAG: family 78 glycoside hydrolase catalytic domain, partial [Planctomycetes bacterium]|nr:family 78 glycoside hydrolase catalytic domain [Planctomycetota bacterium]
MFVGLLALALLTFAAPIRAQEESAPASTSAVRPARSAPTNLRVEWLVEPLGVIDAKPRFSWELADSRPGAKQTAYRIQVASSAEKLARDEADVWDSGVVQSSATVGVEYGGKELLSLATFVWTVTTFDAEGVGVKSQLAQRFGTGPRSAEELGASWIQVPPFTTPRRPAHNGFHSDWATRADAVKWVQLDFAKAERLDSLTLYPTRPFDGPDWPEFLFPLELEVQTADDRDFAVGVRTLARWSAADSPREPLAPLVLDLAEPTVKSVRVVVKKLAANPDGGFGFTLAELEASAWQHNGEDAFTMTIAGRASASDFLATGAWSLANLVDGDTTSHAAEEDASGPTTMFVKQFRLPSKPISATLRATAAGLYEVHINGIGIVTSPIQPLWTNYDVRSELATRSSLQSCVKRGWNELRFEVADGWFAGRLGLAHVVPDGAARGIYGRVPALLARLDVVCEGGERVSVVTDESWHWSRETRTRSADLLDGVEDEASFPVRWQVFSGLDGLHGVYNSGRDLAVVDWQSAHAWPAHARDGKRVWLDPERCERVDVVERLKPSSVVQVEPTTWLVDFGQNCTGTISATVEGRSGDVVEVRYGEALDASGRLYRGNLRGAAQVDRFTLGASGARPDATPEPFETRIEPRFTLHGFRYAEFRGLDQAPTHVESRVLSRAARETGTFESSSELLNKLWQAIRWTQRSNLIGIPTDCPQRDERLGWMGDIQVFAPTACYQQDLAAFFTKWMFDVRDAQARDGRFPDFAPHPFDPNARFSGAPAWADAGVLVPWTAYTFYGDRRLLENQVEAAERWVEFVRATNPDGVWRNERGNDYGDWLNGDWIELDGWKKQGANVPKDLFATAFHARSAQTLSKLEAALGRRAQAAEFAKLFETIRQAFVREFVKPDGSLVGDTQAGYALALEFDLLPEFARELALERLVADIDARGGHLSTGIQATPRAL